MANFTYEEFLGSISLLGLVTMISCYQLATFAQRVGKVRTKHKVEPPEVNGPEEFQRAFRAQQNTLEFFPIFMGCLWTAGIFFHQVPTSLVGLYYLYQREQYFTGYSEDAKKRIGPFKKTVPALQLFLVMGLSGAINAVAAHFLEINIKNYLYKTLLG